MDKKELRSHIFAIGNMIDGIGQFISCKEQKIPIFNDDEEAFNKLIIAYIVLIRDKLKEIKNYIHNIDLDHPESKDISIYLYGHLRKFDPIMEKYKHLIDKV